MSHQPMNCRHCGDAVYPNMGHYCEKLSQNFYAEDTDFRVVASDAKSVTFDGDGDAD